MRATGFTPRERKQFQIDNFGGVDFSESPISANKRRATKGKNFILTDGINQKRKGWEERLRILKSGQPQRINGVWHFETQQYTDKHHTSREPAAFTVVHAGTALYVVDLEKEIAVSPIYEGITDERSYGIYNDGKLYIFCGDYLVFGQFSDSDYTKNKGWEVRRVFNNTDTYIPKTTISIGYVGQKDDKTTALDKPNMLRTRRKNGFCTTSEILDKDGKPPTSESPAVNAEAIKQYQVDTHVMDNGPVIATLTTIEAGKPVETVYRNKLIDGTYGNKLSALGSPDTWATVDFTTGTITLAAPIETYSEGDDNLVVEFAYKPRDADGNLITGYESRITGCRFGARFGNAGVDDRLFVAGNMEYPNLCYHSGRDDFTYFADEDVAICGSDSAAITGFSRLGDGTLAIHKEANGQDISIYYRAGETRTETEDGGATKHYTIFPVRAGAIGEGVVSPWACANFSGDNLMLSDNGVFGLVLSTNVATNERYARERSRMINKRLIRENLSDAVAVVYKNQYWLSVDGNCYVADARHTFREQGDMADTFNYEWWFLGHIPARVWAVMDNDLWFGTPDGQLCKFDDRYSDRSYQHVEQGEMMIDYANNRLNIRSRLFDSLIKSDLVTLHSAEGMIAAILAPKEAVTVQNGRIKLGNGVILSEDMTVYVDETEEIENKAYTPGEINFAESSFVLMDGDRRVEPTESFRLCVSIEDIELEVADAENTGAETFFRVRHPGWEQPLELTAYRGNAASLLSADMCFKRNVAAEWYTPMLDLGSSAYRKRLTALRIVMEPGVSGEISFGYETLNAEKTDYRYSSSDFSFSDIDFREFSFNINTFASTYTRRVFERSFNFIMLRVASDSDVNCAINSFGVEYALITKTKGVQ